MVTFTSECGKGENERSKKNQQSFDMFHFESNGDEGSEHNYQRDYWSKWNWRWNVNQKSASRDARTHPPLYRYRNWNILTANKTQHYAHSKTKKNPTESSLLQSNKTGRFFCVRSFVHWLVCRISCIDSSSVVVSFQKCVATKERTHKNCALCGRSKHCEWRRNNWFHWGIGGFHAWWFHFLFLNTLICFIEN